MNSAQTTPQTNSNLLENNLAEYHHLTLKDPILEKVLADPSLVGLNEADLQDKHPTQRAELIVGEYFALIAKTAGRIASELLHHAQWEYKSPDWFDHRHHMLFPERHCNDFWTLSADNILRVLPMGGSLLNFCSGDGFYDYYFYRKRAAEVTAIDLNPACYRQAVRLHSAANINYIHDNVLTYDFKKEHYDVVSIRGAIEHFSEENQRILFHKAREALKPGGWFCGDTVANPARGTQKMLEAHEHEWVDETEMRRALVPFFEYIETSTITSAERVTLLWRCLKRRQ